MAERELIEFRDRAESPLKIGLLEIQGSPHLIPAVLRQRSQRGRAIVPFLCQPYFVPVEVVEQAGVVGCKDELSAVRVRRGILEQLKQVR